MSDFSVAQAERAPTGWDRYLAARGAAHLYVREAWVRFAADVFGFRSFFLSAHGPSGDLVGTLPLILQRSLLFGSRLVSMPFFNYGGAIADRADIRRALIDAAAALGRSMRVHTVELRDDQPDEGVAVRTDKVTMLLELPATPAELLKRLGSKLRSQIRRADRVQPSVAVGGAELVADFYAVFAPTMRDLGTPVYPRRFFDVLMERCGADCRLVVVAIGGQPAAAALLARHPTRLEIPWAASLRDYRADSVNMRLYWEVLSHAIESGCRQFDFGRSTVDSGTYRFKQQWGAVPRQLYWKYPLASPTAALRPDRDSGVVGLAKRVWTRLPTPIANRVGAALSPGLPW